MLLPQDHQRDAAALQLGNAFPPPVAEAFARQIKRAIQGLQPRRAAQTVRELRVFQSN